MLSNPNHPTMIVLITILGLVTGFGAGKIDIDTVTQYAKESYINRYLAMSGTERQHITYYVYSRQAHQLRVAVTSIPGVVSVNEVRPDHLFDVVINYPQRRDVVKALKKIPEVSAVFTVPLMCH